VIHRRHILMGAAAASVKATAAAKSKADLSAKLNQAMESPVLRTEHFKQPVKIASVELLKFDKRYLVRATSMDGATGYSDAHSVVMNSANQIVTQKVAPFYIGKDARDLDSLNRGVYLDSSNYKWQGLPFWVSVAVVELALLDMLGKVSGQPLGALIGKVVRPKIAVYRASSHRGNAPEAEIQYLQQQVQETGASAIKFRLGARMHYTEASTRRDKALIAMTRKAFGDKFTIYADANGSYDVPLSMEIGKRMEDHGLAFLEEPVPFDYYDETKQIADSLKLPIALGECEMSLRNFRRIIETETAQVIQPDLLYFGGLIRSMKVARMAAAAGLECTPHMSGGGLGFLYIAHFASCAPNMGPHQEYKGEEDNLPVSSTTSSLKSEGGLLTVPTGPGLGVQIDPKFLANFRPVA
jgi:L-alanine-DL-glutamate epimerase-like enolase superfamily enzyme